MKLSWLKQLKSLLDTSAIRLYKESADIERVTWSFSRLFWDRGISLSGAEEYDKCQVST